MANAQSLIRQILRLCGDPNGQRISKEDIVDLINEEAPRVMARFPSLITIDTAQEATEATYGITSADINLNRHKIVKVFLDQSLAREVSSDEMERITHEL